MRIGRFPLYFSVGYRAATIDHAKHALSVVRTLITAHFVAISRGTSMWHPARKGFSLFTLIVKFNIHDNAHCSWNSSSDARIGSITSCSYHTVYRYISLFFVTMLLLTRLSFVANSPLNAVFTFILPSLSTASRTRSRAIFSASSKNRLDVIRPTRCD